MGPRRILAPGVYLSAPGFSILIPWTDENWGPRYLYSSIAPLVLASLSSVGESRFASVRESPLVVAVIFGLFVSVLGAAYSYGALHHVATETTQSTLEALQGDPVWNHVKFNARLLQVWIGSHWGGSTVWRPYHHWYFSVPFDAPPLKSFDLREVMEPQAVLVRSWPTAEKPFRLLWLFHLLALLGGCTLIGMAAARILRQPDPFAFQIAGLERAGLPSGPAPESELPR